MLNRASRLFSNLQRGNLSNERHVFGWLDGWWNPKGSKEQPKETKDKKEAKGQENAEESDNNHDSDDESGGLLMPIPTGVAGLFYSQRN